jgi:GH24 family phage-related lysozyme (muramidase)
MTDACPAVRLGLAAKCLAPSGGCDRVLNGKPCANKKGTMTMDISDYFDDLDAHEGCTTWLYCDVRGFVTVGIGNLVATEDVAAVHPFFHRADGSAATDEEKRAGWNAVKGAFDATKSAAFYESACDLRLPVEYVQGLVATRLATEFIPGIVRLCPQFSTFPLPARRALVDMAYNLGVHGLGMFPHMLAACNAGDWAMAAGQCHRSSCRDTRNAWTAQCFIDAEVATPGPTS